MVQPRWMVLGLVLLFPFAGIVYWAFLHGWWLNFVVPALFTLIPNVSLVALYRVLIEEQEKRKVRGAFQQYVSPEVIRRLLKRSGAREAAQDGSDRALQRHPRLHHDFGIARRAGTRGPC